MYRVEKGEDGSVGAEAQGQALYVCGGGGVGGRAGAARLGTSRVGGWICGLGGPAVCVVWGGWRVTVSRADFRAVLSGPGAQGWGPGEVRAPGNWE